MDTGEHSKCASAGGIIVMVFGDEPRDLLRQLPRELVLPGGRAESDLCLERERWESFPHPVRPVSEPTDLADDSRGHRDEIGARGPITNPRGVGAAGMRNNSALVLPSARLGRVPIDTPWRPGALGATIWMTWSRAFWAGVSDLHCLVGG